MNPSTLYISRSDGIYRIPNADKGTVGSGGALKPELLKGVTEPSVIAVDPNGVLYAVTNPRSFGVPKRAYRYDSKTSTFIEISDDTFRGTVGRNYTLSVSVDGTLYAPYSGSGLYIGDPN